jgi:tRNA/rRNA methyltransferase
MEKIRVVLVRPKYSRNVGMVARAMANYGLKHLILIEPQCAIDMEAHEGAAGGQGPLQKIQIYPHWQRFYDWEQEGIRIAFSARDGKKRETFDFANSLQTDQTFLEELQNKTTYLIFGPEDHGLSESDLDFVHRVVHLQLPGEIKSMNLSHAVLTALTLIHSSYKAQSAIETEEPKEKFFFPEQTLKKWMEALHMDVTTHHRVNAYSVLKKLMLKSFPTPKELKMFETVVQQTLRKLKESSGKNSSLDQDNLL